MATKVKNGLVVDATDESIIDPTGEFPTSGGAFVQTYATTAFTVPNATVSAPPAGGTGATAGAYDTAGNRDLLIASVNALIADVLAIRKTLNAVIDTLQLNGLAT